MFSPIFSSSSSASLPRIGARALKSQELGETRSSIPSSAQGGDDDGIVPRKALVSKSMALGSHAHNSSHTCSSIVTHTIPSIPSMPTTTTTHPTTTHPPRTKLSRTTQNMVSEVKVPLKVPLVSDNAFPLLRATTSSIPFASTIAVASSEEAIADREVVSAGHSGEGSAGWVASCVKGIEGEDSKGMGEMTASMSGGNGE